MSNTEIANTGEAGTVKTPKNYLLTAIMGSSWNLLQFFISFTVSTSVSIILLRYFGAAQYGVFAYLTWFSSVVLLIVNFGLIATIQTWVPKYYFTGDVASAAYITRKIFKLQLGILLVAFAALIPLILIWHKFVNFSPHTFTLLMFANLLPMLTSILDISLSTLLVSLQRFKQAVLIYITGQFFILASGVLTAVLHLDLLVLVIMLGGANLVMLVLFVRAGRDILFYSAPTWKGKSFFKNMVSFSGWAYLITLISAVIWDKSEFFFLGKYRVGSDVAIYGIAYTLANTTTSVLDPIISVFTTLLSELVAKNDWERIHLIIRLCSKYFSLLLFPLVALAFSLSRYFVGFVYGPALLLVASIFPLLLFSTILNKIFSPAWSIPMYMHDFPKFVPRIAIFVPVNIGLDFLLIPKYGVWGATLANVITQVSAFVYFVYFVRRYRIRLFTAEYFRIFSLNAVLFTVIFLTTRHQASFILSLVISLAAIALYGLIVFLHFIKTEDRQLILNSVRMIRHRATV